MTTTQGDDVRPHARPDVQVDIQADLDPDVAATAAVDPGVEVDVEWGVAGARHLAASARRADVVVVVDVLSFCTAVTVACERGARVWPHPGGESAHALARSLEAVLAGTRSHTGPSLSPASLLDLPEGTRLVLPSPNGSTISHLLMGSTATVLLGCLRNASAVAKRAAEELVGRPGGRVAVVAAGEVWGDGSLRVAYEDHVGAGAIVARLAELVPLAELSPDAQVAALAFEHLVGLEQVPSGRELVQRGYAQDVRIAAQVDASQAVPLLRDGSFTAA